LVLDILNFIIGAERGAGRKLGGVVSGYCRKLSSRSGAGGHGAGSGGYRNWLQRSGNFCCSHSTHMLCRTGHAVCCTHYVQTRKYFWIGAAYLICVL